MMIVMDQKGERDLTIHWGGGRMQTIKLPRPGEPPQRAEDDRGCLVVEVSVADDGRVYHVIKAYDRLRTENRRLSPPQRGKETT